MTNDFIKEMDDLGYKVKVISSDEITIKRGLNPEMKMDMNSIRKLFLKTLVAHIEMKMDEI